MDSHSVGACVADTNARGQLMLILGTMHNFEEYAIVIQKMMVPFFKINFDTILTVFKLSAGYCFMKPTHITKTYAYSISYESPSCVENEFTFSLNFYGQCSDSERL